MKYKDYYEILGVNKNDDQDTIKKAYRKLAKKYHPDSSGGNEAKFKEINEAYEVLGNTNNRKKYDEFGSNYDFQNGFDFDPGEFQKGNTRYSFRGSNASGFSDFFNMFFGGERGFNFDDILSGFTGGGRRGAEDGRDSEAEIEIEIEDGLKGLEKKYSIYQNGKTRNISLKIPKGIKENEKIKLRGQAGKGNYGGKDGDLYLKIKFRKNSIFQVEGIDIIGEMELYPWQAALGDNVNFSTLDGNISVKIPKGIQTGNKVRVRGRGYIDSYGRRGDLYIKIKIVNPLYITKEMEKLYINMKKINERR